MSYRREHDLTLPILGATFLLACLMGAFTPSLLNKVSKLDTALAQIGWYTIAAVGLCATFLALISLFNVGLAKLDSISLDFDRNTIRKGSHEVAKLSDVAAVDIHQIKAPTKFSSDIYAISVALHDGHIVGVYRSQSAQNAEQIGREIAMYTGRPVPKVRQ